MGDKIVIKEIAFIQDSLYQIDLYNETKKEWYRVFADKDELENKMRIAKGKQINGEENLS